MSWKRHAPLLAAAGLIAGVAGIAPSGSLAGASASRNTPGFGQPTISGIQADGFEQDLAVDTRHRPEVLYTSAPIGLGSTSVIWRSTDGGLTFKEVPSQIPPLGKPLACVAGGDSELATDSAGHLYFADLWLGNFATARSDDRGKTWQAATGNCAGVPDGGVDRQWYASLGDPTHGGVMFLVYDEAPNTAAIAHCPDNRPTVNSSRQVVLKNVLQITRTPVAPQAGSSAGTVFTAPMSLSCNEGIMGNDVVFRYPGSAPSGGAKVFVVHDNFDFNQVMVNRCDVTTPSASNPVGVTNCVEKTVANFPHGRTGASFPTMSVDDKGGLFVVWPQASVASRLGRRTVTSDTQLWFSTSTNRGLSWSKPRVLPTPGLHQHVMPWTTSGDAGRTDIAYYATSAKWTADTGKQGPDSIKGRWGLYLSQTLDNGRTWSKPVLASEHFVHWGTVQSFIGDRSGNRGLGDFLVVRTGPQGEAEISYADTNNFGANSALSPQAMYVRQNTGPSLYKRVGYVHGPAAPKSNCVRDPKNDGTYDANGVIGPNNPDLDLLSACMSQAGDSYLVKLSVADLTSVGPNPTAGGTTNVWQIIWHSPSTTDQVNGGALFEAYAESVAGGAPTCWVGQSSLVNAELTYPGTRQLTGQLCSVQRGAPGTITMRIPKSWVRVGGAVSSTLYSVTASTQTLQAGNAETPNSTEGQATGGSGQLPNVIDVAPAFDMHPGARTYVPRSGAVVGVAGPTGTTALASRMRALRPAADVVLVGLVVALLMTAARAAAGRLRTRVAAGA